MYCSVFFNNFVVTYRKKIINMKIFTVMKGVALGILLAGMPMSAFAGWGTQTRAETIYQKNGEIFQFHTARTSDGYIYMSWLEWNSEWHPASSIMLCMQLLDPDGNRMWGDDGLVIDSYPTKSYTTNNSLVVDEEGNAYVSWADSRSQIDKTLTDEDSRYDYFEPVVYKLNKDGEMLWGDDGKTYDNSKYSVTPILYTSGGNVYAMFYGMGEGSTIPTYMVRLDSATGEFAFEPKPMGGMLAGSVGTDVINVYAGATTTVAMRYDEDLNPVWPEATEVAPFTYAGHGNFPYTLLSDGQGGVIVSLERNLSTSKWMPVVNYITADGESLFGNAVDVTTNLYNNNTMNFMVYNPVEETILSLWSMNNPTTALYGQMMDVFGDRLWNDGEGMELAYKLTGNDYTFAPLSAVCTKDNTYWVLYVDEYNWMQYTMYLICIDGEGNVIEGYDSDGLNTMRVGPFNQGILSPNVYWDNGSMYLIYYNYNSSNTYMIRTIKVADLYAPLGGTDDSGIGSVTEAAGHTTCYGLDGILRDSPRKGINIVKDSEGKVSKILVK